MLNLYESFFTLIFAVLLVKIVNLAPRDPHLTMEDDYVQGICTWVLNFTFLAPRRIRVQNITIKGSCTCTRPSGQSFANFAQLITNKLFRSYDVAFFYFVFVLF